MRAQEGTEYKTSDLVAHFSATQGGGSVNCTAYFSLASDPSAVAIALEADAIVTCNATQMTPVASHYTGVLPYVAGGLYTITLLRPIDGSSTLTTITVP